MTFPEVSLQLAFSVSLVQKLATEVAQIPRRRRIAAPHPTSLSHRQALHNKIVWLGDCRKSVGTGLFTWAFHFLSLPVFGHVWWLSFLHVDHNLPNDGFLRFHLNRLWTQGCTSQLLLLVASNQLKSRFFCVLFWPSRPHTTYAQAPFMQN